MSAESTRGASPQPLWVIVGPTGSGKTELALAVAQLMAASGQPVDIISADAMQLYRGMDIGTAKATLEQRSLVKHHLLDIWDPSDEASVEEYQKRARAVIQSCHDREVIPLLVGGSGLYVSSVIYDFAFPGHDPEVRRVLEQRLEKDGLQPLVDELTSRDPEAARGIDCDNPRRVIRALEVIALTGQAPLVGLAARGSWWHQPTVIVGVDAPRDWLVDRIERRVDAMFDAGLIDEVRDLHATGLGATAAQAIGYREVVGMLDGLLTPEQARDAIVQHTKRYARKQMSWFRRDPQIAWVDPLQPDLMDRALAIFQSG